MSDLDGAVVHLARWAATAKADDAADRRMKERWEQAAAEDEATIWSVFAGIVERRAPVAVHLRTTATIRGTAVGLGKDYVALAHGGQLSLVAAPAIDWVRPDGPAPPAAFADRVTATGSLVGVLSGVAAERFQARISTSTENLVGQLLAVGSDVVSLRPSGAAADQVVYVPLRAVAEVSIRL